MTQRSNRCGARLALLAVLTLAVIGSQSRPAQAGEIVGRPRVIDAGRLDFSGRVVRLYGIDAPALAQGCRANGQSWPCGKEARWAAINRIHPHWVTCIEKGRAPDGAVLAVCYLAGVGQHDLNAWLVTEGWALAAPGNSDAYAAPEAAARAAGKGLWRGEFVPPAAWRQGQRLAP